MAVVYETVENWGLKKCGEISTLLSVGKDEFFLSCEFCDYTAQKLSNFIHHMCKTHVREFTENREQKSVDIEENEICNKWEISDEENNDKEYVLRGFERVEIELDTVDIEGSLDLKEEDVSSEYINEDTDVENQAFKDTEDFDTSDAYCYENKVLTTDKTGLEQGDELSEEKVFIIELIELYRCLPTLWNVKHADYNNRSIRKMHYEILLAKYKERYPKADRNDLLRKINSLRTSYRRELKRTTPIGTPSLYYFDAMDFLRRGEPDDDPQSEMSESDDEKLDFAMDEDEFAGKSDSFHFGKISHHETPSSIQRSAKENKKDSERLTDEQKFILELIKLYESLPALWNAKNRDYHDRELKNIQYKVLLQKYRERYPSADKADLKRKINCIRTNFRRQLNRSYPRRLYYFDAMRFLCNIDEAQAAIPEFDNTQHSIKEEDDPYQSDEFYKCDNDSERTDGEEEMNMSIENYDRPSPKNLESFEQPELTSEREFAIELISVYKTMPELWDIKNPDYRNRAIKNRQYKILLAKYREKYPNAVKDDVKRKINSLRSNFRRDSKRKSIMGTTNLFYYNAMSFLLKNYPYLESQNESQDLEDMEQNFEEPGAAKHMEDIFESDNDSQFEEAEQYLDVKTEENMEPDINVNQRNDKSRNENDFILKIIQVYRSLPALWNTKVKSYYDRQLKKAQYEVLLQKYKQRYPDADLNDLKKKINGLRIGYRRELRRTHHSGAFSTLYYFAAMDFLRANDMACESSNTMHALEQTKQNLKIPEAVRNSEDLSESDTNSEYEEAGQFKNSEDLLESDNNSEYEEANQYLHKKTEDNMEPNSYVDQRDGKSTNENDFILKFIQVYRSLPALWNTEVKSYYDRKLKKAQYEVLLRMYIQRYPDADLSDIKRKINGLRCNYRRELRRTHQSATSSTLYYFKAMNFLRAKEMSFGSRSGMDKHDGASTDPNTELFTKPSSLLNESQLINLANIYKGHLCLWDEDDIAYRFANRRREAMADILEELNQKCELNLTKCELEREISQLRKICSFEKKQKIICKKTKTTYKPKCPFYEHLEFAEVYLPPFECPVCEEVITRLGQYKLHLASHDGTLPYKCSVCGHGFHLASNLAVHCRRHVQDYTYSCEICSKPCATTTELKSHMLNHTGEKPYVCDICGKSVRWLREFKEHKMRHEKRPGYKCELCPKAFYRRCKLKEHMSVHTQVRDKICNVCNKGFTTRKQLCQHKHIHDVEKKFICKFCGKRFAQPAGLSGHVKSHGTSLSAQLPV